MHTYIGVGMGTSDTIGSHRLVEIGGGRHRYMYYRYSGVYIMYVVEVNMYI